MNIYYSNKAVVTLSIKSIYKFTLFYFCLPEVGIEEGQSCATPHIPPTSENVGIFVSPCTNS